MLVAIGLLLGVEAFIPFHTGALFATETLRVSSAAAFGIAIGVASSFTRRGGWGAPLLRRHPRPKTNDPLARRVATVPETGDHAPIAGPGKYQRMVIT